MTGGYLVIAVPRLPDCGNTNPPIAATHRLHTIDYGVLETNQTKMLTGFSEKPTMRYMVCMGINVARRTILSRIPPHRKYGFDDLLLELLHRGERVQVEPYDGYWLDIGRPDDYMQASEQFEQNKDLFLKRMRRSWSRAQMGLLGDIWCPH
jgi:NDP-sugar pyrophosphorylase family protein